MDGFQHAPHAVAVIRHHVGRRPQAEAVTLVRDPDREDGATRLSYSQLDAEARRIASWLQDNFAAGDRILLLYPVGVDFVAAFFGCMYAGMIAVPAPLPGQYSHERQRVKRIAVDAAVTAVFTDSSNLAGVQEWTNAEKLGDIPVLGTDTGNFGAADAWVMPAIDRETLVLLQYTSGSTGEPKGVMISHHNLLYNVASYQKALGFTESTRFGGWIPLYHDMGLMAQLLPALFLGSACVLMTPQTFLMRPHLWLRMIDKHDLHYSAAPNFAYELCCRRITDEQLARLDLSRWEFATNGSEPVQASTLLNFARCFAPAGFRLQTLCPCYGMAEATVFASGSSHRPPLIQHADADWLERRSFKPATEGAFARRLVSCGIAHGYDVRIVEPDSGAVLPENRVGEIWLRGESVSRGYWRNESATREVFGAVTAEGAGGFLRTGDFGLIHEGELYVTGRLKEIMILHGRNLYPQDIEHELRAQHPELSTRFGAVFTVIPPEGGEAVVVTHEIKGNFDTGRLLALVRGIRITVQREFGVHAAGVVLLRSGTVQRTTSGKIRRSDMRRLFQSDDLPALIEDLDTHIAQAFRPNSSESIVARGELVQ